MHAEGMRLASTKPRRIGWEGDEDLTTALILSVRRGVIGLSEPALTLEALLHCMCVEPGVAESGTGIG
jgi:hypothetical protein